MFQKVAILQHIKNKYTLSLYAVLFIVLFCICTAHINKIWCGNSPYCYDSKQYYSYLPKFFLEHDMEFKNQGDYWVDFLPNKKPFIKYTSGIAILQAPFFLMAWLISDVFGIPLEGGYSQLFIELIHYGIFIYFFIGLLCLRKVLHYFKISEVIIAITLLTTFFGTNLFHYILAQGLMTHGFLFSLHCMFLYLTILFYKNPSVKYSILLGLVGGLISLIRPTEILCFLVWFLWEVNSFVLLKERVLFLVKKIKPLLFIGLFFIIVWIPQMIYWHHITGKLLFYAYKEERLFYTDPKIIQVLFSPRNGLLPYCPVLFLYLVALCIPFKINKSKIGIALFVILNIYLVSCWWCWWYGGCFSMRALIQIFPYLSIGFAFMLHHVFYNMVKRRIVVKLSLSVLIVFLVFMHLKFWYQSKLGFVHYDSMTLKSYLYVLPKIKLNQKQTAKYYRMLKQPDIEKASKGIR
jgi:hypothetical protein